MCGGRFGGPSGRSAINLWTITEWRSAVPYTKPMKAVCVWLSPEEKAVLATHARARKVSLSFVLLEGVRLYREEAGLQRPSDAPTDGQLAIT